MGISQKSMVSGWALLITFLVVSDLGCWAEATAEEGINDNQTEGEEVQHPWLGSLLGLTRRDLRADKEDMFWATRGKRNTEDSDFWAIRGKKQYIKPNGFFQAIATPTPGKRSMDFWRTGKRSLKPNGLFGSIKRASLKPNSLFTSFKRTGLRPNGLFGSLKRANLGLKPNGLFGAYKRAGLKPNGLFGAYKRAGLKPNGLFGAYKRAGLKPNGLFGAYKRPVLKPNGLFGAYKRSLKPNGLFGMSKKSWVPTQFGWEEIDDFTGEDMDEDEEYFNYVDMEDIYDYLYDEEDAEDDILPHDHLHEGKNPVNDDPIEKREDADFWAARGKKEDADFWATRG